MEFKQGEEEERKRGGRGLVGGREDGTVRQRERQRQRRRGRNPNSPYQVSPYDYLSRPEKYFAVPRVQTKTLTQP